MDLTDIINSLQTAIFEGNVGDKNLFGLYQYIDQIIDYAYGLAAVLMIILVGSKVITYFANPSGNLDPYTLVRPILILVALVLYKPLVELLLFSPTDIIADVTENAAHYVTKVGDAKEFEDSYNGSITHIQDSNADGSGDGVYDVLQINPFLELLHLIIFFIASVVAGYIMLRQIIYKAIYFVIGVFALPLALIPGNQDVLKKWFFGFLAVLLWIPILTILKTILILVHNNTASGGFTQILMSICLQVVMIIAVLRVPKYANILVSAGSDSGSNFTASFMTVPAMAMYKKLRGK
ncbi:hypothetical protein [Aquimarina spongiae]|uniref:TrbL/VirB6 plasmid conjugal transfer protein n=1 Tax=Aquimarina spongiae TaxID=570521 RepID=A0A1M6I6D5_9FLAO|nr:hypothetical protein [Aquimarina spongiae]SHJ29960.1 hypothetical protein SAMN04488508_107143 [Aquimarina spongiae]